MNPAQIVIIEDNPADVHLVELALKDQHIEYTLIRYENGVDAVEALCKPAVDGPPPDAILLDLNTPRTDGFEALRKLKQAPHLARVPLAILTSSRARSDKHRAAIQGARYIEKPSQLKEFVSTVGRAIEEMLRPDAGLVPSSIQADH